MHALTVKQPWAKAIAAFGKNVENRSRRPPKHLLGQRIAIHAGQALDDWQWMRDGTEPFHDHRHPLYLWAQHSEGHTSGRAPDAGRIIATARLVGYQEHGGAYFSHGDDGQDDPFWRPNDSPWRTSDRFGWVLADVRPLRKPVGTPCAACGGSGSVPYQTFSGAAYEPCFRPDFGPIRGQVYPFALSPEVEAAVLAAEAA